MTYLLQAVIKAVKTVREEKKAYKYEAECCETTFYINVSR